MSHFENRFVARATQDPDGFAEAVRQQYGLDPAQVDTCLRIASKLSQPSGGLISAADVQALQAMYPGTDPSYIADRAAEINKAPAHVRAMGFTAAVVGDANVWNNLDLSNASPAYRQVEELTRSYATQEYADAINAKRGGEAVEPRAPKPQAHDVRSLIESHFTPPGQRAVQEALDRGDPDVEHAARNLLADRIEQASERLQQPEASTRDTVAAAFDLHMGESLAASEYGVGEN